MIHSELARTFNNTKSRIIFILMFLLPLIDFFQHVYNDIILFGSYSPENNPVFTSFLSGSSMGNFTQVLLFFILPLYFLLLYSDSYILDRNCGYIKCLISRVGKKEYYKTKFKIAFFVPTITIFISLTLNLIMSLIIFHSGTSFGGFEDFYQDMNGWFIFGFHHPYVYYFIFMVTVSIICGLSGILGLCCSIIFKNYYIAYPVTFCIWIFQIIIPYGIGNTIQPFTEYGIQFFLSGLSIFLISVLIVFIITYFMRLKKDEI